MGQPEPEGGLLEAEAAAAATVAATTDDSADAADSAGRPVSSDLPVTEWPEGGLIVVGQILPFSKF